MDPKAQPSGFIASRASDSPAQGLSSPGRALQYVLLAQIIGCVLVVFGHSYPYEGVPEAADRLRDFVYSFHMPLFIWCSGYLLVVSNASSKYRFGDFVKRRATRLLLPYLAFSVVGLLPKALFADVLNDPIELGFQEIVVAFLVPRQNVWGHFWFLPMIFLIGILGYAVDKVVSSSGHRRLMLGVITAISASLIYLPEATDWFGLGDMQRHLLFFLLGMMAADARPLVERTPLVVAPIAASSAIGLFMLDRTYLGPVIAVLMIVAVVSLTVSFGSRFQISRNALLAQTYQIFILSWPFQLIVEIITEKILGLGFVIVMPSMFAAGLVLPILTLRLVNAFEIKTGTRVISLMLGR